MGSSGRQVSATPILLCAADLTMSRPVNKEELYNLRHSSARNAVERIFGILKKRFAILTYSSEYSMAIQARIPPALAAVHNFIRLHDTDEISNFDLDIMDPNPGARHGELARGPARRIKKDRAELVRNEIASAMWDNYQTFVNAQYD